MFSLKVPHLYWDFSVMEGYVFTWYKLAYNSQEVLKNGNTHFSVWISTAGLAHTLSTYIKNWKEMSLHSNR